MQGEGEEGRGKEKKRKKGEWVFLCAAVIVVDSKQRLESVQNYRILVVTPNIFFFNLHTTQGCDDMGIL